MSKLQRLQHLKNPWIDSGFSLIELSTVLVIISVLAGAAISIGINQTDRVNVKETEIKLQSIQEALTSYLTVNRRLPCPAEGSTALNDLTIGREVLTGNNCDTTEGTADTSFGVIPSATLQIPREFMFDGWGRRFTYVVSNNLASLDAANNFVTTNDGVITVFAENGTRTNVAAYVIISHGVNGNGAWPRNGGARLAGTINIAEEENNHISSTLDNEYLMQDESNTFDDLVHYKTKQILLFETKALFSELACEQAENIVDGGTDCSLAASQDRCRAMATIFYDMCL